MRRSIMGGLSVAVLSLTLAHAAPIYAMPGDGSMKQCMMMEKIDEIKATLALTPEQERKLQAIKEKTKVFMIRAHKEKHMIREEANQIAEAKDIDAIKLDKLADRACQLEKDRLKYRVMTKHDVLQILTPQQQEQLKDAMRKGMENRMDMMNQDMMKQDQDMMNQDMMKQDMPQ